MSVIDLTNERVVVEADGSTRCMNCIEGQDYWKGSRPSEEIFVSKDDLQDPERLYICDYCEQVS